MRAAKALAVLVSVPVLIGALRVPYEAYYHSLGTSVEQVGLSTWRMTTFPLLVVLLFAATSGPAVLAGASLFLWLERQGGKATRRSELRRLVDTVLIALGAVCLSYVTFFAILVGISHAGRVWIPIGVLLGGLVLTGVAYLGSTITNSGVSGDSPPAPGRQSSTTTEGRLVRLWLATFLIFMGVALAAAWGFLWLKADSAASRLREDGSSSASPFIGLLDINPIPVCPAGAASSGSVPPGVPTDRPVLLLGSGRGMVVLRDTKETVTLLIPSGALVLRSSSGHPPTCS